jgi:prophage regulatory protein
MSKKIKLPQNVTILSTPPAPYKHELGQSIILRQPEVRRRTGLGRSSLYEAIKRGEFPDKIALGPRAVGWDSIAVQNWIEAKVNANNASTCNSEVSMTGLATQKGKITTIKSSSNVLPDDMGVKKTVLQETCLDIVKIGGAI